MPKPAGHGFAGGQPTGFVLPRASITACSSQRSGQGGRHAGLHFRAYITSRGFDSTLGYPGEGPRFGLPSWTSFTGFLLSWILPIGLRSLSFTPAPTYSCGCLAARRLHLKKGWFRVLFLSFFVLSASLIPLRAAMETAGDHSRRLRREGLVLHDGRPVLPATRTRREKLSDAFRVWLEERVTSWHQMETWARTDVTLFNEALWQYGRWLFEEGKPYSHYSEMINMAAIVFPTLRRQLQPSWDLAFSWMREEPPTHHTALPWQVLCAMLTVAITWGWTRVVAILAICWGGLARVGEVLAARRKDLVLPLDIGEQTQQLFLSLNELKTRFRAARHQCLKLDQCQLVRLVVLTYQATPPDEKLWTRYLEEQVYAAVEVIVSDTGAGTRCQRL